MSFKEIFYLAMCLIAFQIGLINSKNVLSEPYSTKISPSLINLFQKGDKIDVFISFKAGTTSVLNSISMLKMSVRSTRINSLVSSLKKNAAFSQLRLLHLLNLKNNEEKGPNYTSFWITNQIFIRNADFELVEKIMELDEVSKVSHEENYILDAPVQVSKGKKPDPNEIQWGVDKIEAPKVWASESRNRGEGALVGSIDSGARVTHETLTNNFVGNYGWFDPYDGTQVPIDPSGHGTHTLATMVGSHGVGVAPGAKWMSCRGCKPMYCSPEALLSCAQFILCPTDPNGQNPDCSSAPHVVSNSYGGGQGRDLLWPAFSAWVLADIIPVFSNGNMGSYCGTANSHADSPHVIGVGSTNSSDSLSQFSSVGPSVYGTIKPDIGAPGTHVLSAYHTGDNDYFIMSGTSMAAPHVSGAIALLKSEDLTLSYDEIKHYLYLGAVRELGVTGKSCGGIPENIYPNNAYGHGRLNIFNSLRIYEDEKKNEKLMLLL